MDIINKINSDIIKRKVSDTLYEVKTFSTEGYLTEHYFIDTDRQLQGEFISFYSDGSKHAIIHFLDDKFHGDYKIYYGSELFIHRLYEYDKVIIDYLK